MRSGVQGYLLKDVEPQVLFESLRNVLHAEASISLRMAAKLLGGFARQGRGAKEVAQPSDTLTQREKAILELIAGGKSNKEVATALGLSENTVKLHLKNLLGKLHLENRVQAAAYALRERLVSIPKRDAPSTAAPS